MFLREGLAGSARGDWALPEASSLRAFVHVLRMQDPAHFGNPWRFSTDGGLLALRRRRCVELKHGRISRLAATGYITPEATPAFPSAGLKFDPQYLKHPPAVSKIHALR